MKAYDYWIKEQIKRIEFFNSPSGKELQLCLISQGYEDMVFIQWILLSGSGFTVIEIIKDLRKYLK